MFGSTYTTRNKAFVNHFCKSANCEVILPPWSDALLCRPAACSIMSFSTITSATRIKCFFLSLFLSPSLWPFRSKCDYLSYQPQHAVGKALWTGSLAVSFCPTDPPFQRPSIFMQNKGLFRILTHDIYPCLLNQSKHSDSTYKIIETVAVTAELRITI